MHGEEPYLISVFNSTFMRWQSGNTLLDITQGQFTGYSSGNISRVIFLYNKPDWFNVDMFNTVLQECKFNNCRLTKDKSQLEEASAVLFYFPFDPEDMVAPPVTPAERNPDQAWIFLSVEPPPIYFVQAWNSPKWSNVFNWSMTYRFDADIFSPYGSLFLNKNVPVKDYSAIFTKKNKMAVLVASNCITQSKRELFVEKLQNLGVDVDVFGRCGKTLDLRLNETLSQYKYYLSFENAFCRDYVTEKFFDRYNNDLILVVRGGANYHELLPNGTFVNTADFDSVEDLAKYLKYLASDKENYIDFLRRKDAYISSGPSWPFAWRNRFCNLCYKVNNFEKFRKSYSSPYHFLYANQCFRPRDV